MRTGRPRKYPDIEEWAAKIANFKRTSPRRHFPRISTRDACQILVSLKILPPEAELIPIGTFNRELRKLCMAPVKRKTIKRKSVPEAHSVIPLPIHPFVEWGRRTVIPRPYFVRLDEIPEQSTAGRDARPTNN